MDASWGKILLCAEIETKIWPRSMGVVMRLQEIIDRLGISHVHEVRHITDEYGELVVDNKDIEEWNRRFSDILGSPIKPAGVRPSKDDLNLTKNYGGIWASQTLFKKEYDDFTLIAMYWPWQDGAHVTVKMAHLRR